MKILRTIHNNDNDDEKAIVQCSVLNYPLCQLYANKIKD
jgi:hypothetical protein